MRFRNKYSYSIKAERYAASLCKVRATRERKSFMSEFFFFNWPGAYTSSERIYMKRCRNFSSRRELQVDTLICTRAHTHIY